MHGANDASEGSSPRVDPPQPPAPPTPATKDRKISLTKSAAAVVFGFVVFAWLYLTSLAPIVFHLTMILLAAAAYYEFLRLRPAWAKHSIAGFPLLVLLMGSFIFGGSFAILLSVFAVVVLIPIYHAAPRGNVPDFTLVGWQVFGLFYCAFFAVAAKLFMLPGGAARFVFVLVCTWCCDVFSYLVGKKFGQRKPFANLSPGKTTEGALGGFAAAVAGSAAFFLWDRIHGLIGMSLPHYLILGTLIGICAQMGDLFESALKRFAGVKDAGGLIPEHGGILDRFDSFLFTSAVAYAYFLWTGF